MKNNPTLQILGTALSLITQGNAPHAVKKDTLAQYHQILGRAKDIGRKNQLLSCYAMGAWFIAMNRSDGLSPQENYEIMRDGLRRSRLFRMAVGDADHYLAPKKIEKRKQWAQNTHLRTYENDWVVNLIEGNGEYDLGYDYLECGICKLCRDEGCPELTKYLCRLDYLIAEVMGVHLERTTTLAEGGEKCDFRFSRK